MRTPFSPQSISPKREPQESAELINALAPAREKGLLRGARTRFHQVWRNKWIKFGLRLGCTLLLFAFLLRSVSWATVWGKLSRVDGGLLLVGFAMGLFGVIISAYQWQSLLDGERIRMDLRRLVNLYLVGIAFNHFLPTGMGGDVVKVYYVGRESQNTPAVASSVVMSRFTGFFGMLLISVPAALFWRVTFKPTLITSYLLSCLAMCAALGGVFLIVVVLPRFAHRWLRGKILTMVLKVGTAMHKSVLRPRTMGTAVLFGMFFHLSAALNFYCYSRALGLGSVPVTFFLVAVPFVSLIAFLPISINGFGVRESVFVYIFSQMNMRHPSPEVSLALILLMDVQVLLYGLIGGGIYLLMGLREEKQVRASVSTNSNSGVNMASQELSA
jgi:uncharacterized membrane protein YbhN (UPF0104 family)